VYIADDNKLDIWAVQINLGNTPAFRSSLRLASLFTYTYINYGQPNNPVYHQWIQKPVIEMVIFEVSKEFT